MSELYKKQNPEVVSNIEKNKDKPYITDDVSHTILDMAGLSCKQFVPERSVANELFVPRENRIVNKSIVYDDMVSLR